MSNAQAYDGNYTFLPRSVSSLGSSIFGTANNQTMTPGTNNITMNPFHAALSGGKKSKKGKSKGKKCKGKTLGGKTCKRGRKRGSKSRSKTAGSRKRRSRKRRASKK